MIARVFVAGAALAALAVPACVGAPSRFSARSAASPEAHEAARAQIGRAVTEEPPLPGASTEGWVGLAAPSSGGMPMGHHHMAGMDMSGMEGMDMRDADAGTGMGGMDMSGMEGMDMSGMHMGPPATSSGPTDGGTDAMQGMDHAH